MFYRFFIIFTTAILLNYFRWRFTFLYENFTTYLCFYTISEFIILLTGTFNTYFIAWNTFIDSEAKTTLIENLDINDYPIINILLLTCGEPNDIIIKSIEKVFEIDYPKTKYNLIICDDGKSNELKQYVETCSIQQPCPVFYKNRTKVTGHAKAGNINDALEIWMNNNPDFILVLDADMQCKPNILYSLLSRFYQDNTIIENIAFVQSPQTFSNVEKLDFLGQQYKYFYQIIMKSWTEWGCTPCCGTNVLFRYKHLKEIGGFQYGSVTEDFLTSLVFHSKGLKSTYIDEYLATGLAPFTLRGFYKQRFRWAIGSLQILPKLLTLRKYLTYSQFWIYFNSAFYIYLTPLLIYLISNTLISNQIFGSTWYIYYFTPFCLAHIIVLLILYRKISYIYLLRSFQESIFMINCYTLVLIYYIFKIPYSFQITSKQKSNDLLTGILWCTPYMLFMFWTVWLTLNTKSIHDIVSLVWIYTICFQMLPPFSHILYKKIEFFLM